MYQELYDWREGSAERFEHALICMLLLYHQLARETIAANEAWLAWRWFPKMHMLLHLARQAHTIGNPRNWWCYLDEGAIGFAVDLAESMHILTFCVAVMEKYLVWRELGDE